MTSATPLDGSGMAFEKNDVSFRRERSSKDVSPSLVTGSRKPRSGSLVQSRVPVEIAQWRLRQSVRLRAQMAKITRRAHEERWPPSVVKSLAQAEAEAWAAVARHREDLRSLTAHGNHVYS